MVASLLTIGRCSIVISNFQQVLRVKPPAAEYFAIAYVNGVLFRDSVHSLCRTAILLLRMGSRSPYHRKEIARMVRGRNRRPEAGPSFAEAVSPGVGKWFVPSRLRAHRHRSRCCGSGDDRNRRLASIEPCDVPAHRPPNRRHANDREQTVDGVVPPQMHRSDPD